MKTLNNSTFENAKSIAIFGATGSGKTALAYAIIESLRWQNKEVYFVGHPKPELIEEIGYNHLDSLEEIEDLTDSILYIDEPQLLLEMSTYKMEITLAKVLSLARQRNILIIISTSDTRLLSPKVESYIDYWCVKNCEYSGTKQRSRIRRIIQKNSFIIPEGWRAEINEFLLDSLHRNKNGKYSFNLVHNWTDLLSNAYDGKPLKHLQFEVITQKLEKTHEKLAENSQKTHEKLAENSQNSEKGELKMALKKNVD